jgi:hypothetical protein
MTTHDSTGTPSDFSALDAVVLCGSPLFGLTLGALAGEMFGGLAWRWLGMGVGGALVSGAAYELYFKIAPRVGWHGVSARVASFLLCIGIYGYLAARWGGELGVLIAFGPVPAIAYWGRRVAARLITWARRPRSTS